MLTRFVLSPSRLRWKSVGWPLLMGALLAFNVWANWGTINETHPNVLLGALGLAVAFGMSVMLLFNQRP